MGMRGCKLGNRTRIYLAPLFGLCLGAGTLCGKPASTQDLPLDKIKLPKGFKIEVYARAEGARSMTLGPKGTLFVGTRGDKVYAIRDRDGDHKADEVKVLLSGLNMPNGVAFRDGDLYVAEVSRVSRYSDIEKHLANPPKPKVIRSDFPSDTHHGWKFIAFGPDGKLYVPVGAPCNICQPKADFAAIFRMNPDGTDKEKFASGIRNTVGFDWQPETRVLWFTENGRDWLGNDRPPDELNRAPEKGLFFGYPKCHGKDIVDPQFGDVNACKNQTKPALELGPHVAALGMRFYTGAMFPKSYKNQIFIAEHGSWNRDKPIGYQVMKVAVNGGEATKADVFAEGWLSPSGEAWGRPVDVQVMPDGALLVSDDTAGAIYRISYSGSR